MNKPFEINEEERSDAPNVEDVTLPRIAKTAAQSELRAQKTAEDSIIAHQQSFWEQLVNAAYHIFTLQRALEQAKAILLQDESNKYALRGIEISKNKLFRWLEENGVEIEDPTGQILDKRMEQLVEVEDWSAPGNTAYDTVKETIKPIVRISGGQIRLGQVIGEPANPSLRSSEKEEIV